MKYKKGDLLVNIRNQTLHLVVNGNKKICLVSSANGRLLLSDDAAKEFTTSYSLDLVLICNIGEMYLKMIEP